MARTLAFLRPATPLSPDAHRRRGPSSAARLGPARDSNRTTLEALRDNGLSYSSCPPSRPLGRPKCTLPPTSRLPSEERRQRSLPAPQRCDTTKKAQRQLCVLSSTWKSGAGCNGSTSRSSLPPRPYPCHPAGHRLRGNSTLWSSDRPVQPARGVGTFVIQNFPTGTEVDALEKGF